VGVLLALISSLTMAIKMVSRQRLIRTGVPHSVVNFQFTAFGSCAWIVYNLLRQQPVTGLYFWSIGVGLISGCLSVLVSMFYAIALKNENVQVLSIIGGLDIVYAVALQKIFLNDSCSTTFVLGVSLVVLASLLVCSAKLMATKKHANRAKLVVTRH
jgi:drug/metabolite transporter (DMT)-like permease